MSRIIAVTNQKGGVGKTTSSVNLSASFVATKRKILLIDLDPQGNATVASGAHKDPLEKGCGDVLAGRISLKEAIVKTESGYDLLPTNSDLIATEVQLMQMSGRNTRLKAALESVIHEYDYIFIDCPPALNVLTVNALIAADSVLIPMQCEYFALEGLSGLLNTINQIKETANPTLEIEGLLRTMYDGRNRLTVEVSEQLLKHFPDKVYHTLIPRNVRLAEAPSHGMPILQYDRKSQGAVAYLALAGEMIHRDEAIVT